MPPKFDPNEIKVSKFNHTLQTCCSLSNSVPFTAACILAYRLSSVFSLLSFSFAESGGRRSWCYVITSSEAGSSWIGKGALHWNVCVLVHCCPLVVTATLTLCMWVSPSSLICERRPHIQPLLLAPSTAPHPVQASSAGETVVVLCTLQWACHQCVMS